MYAQAEKKGSEKHILQVKADVISMCVAVGKS